MINMKTHQHMVLKLDESKTKLGLDNYTQAMLNVDSWHTKRMKTRIKELADSYDAKMAKTKVTPPQLSEEPKGLNLDKANTRPTREKAETRM